MTCILNSYWWTLFQSTTAGSHLQYDGSREDAIPACFSSHLKEVKLLYTFGCLKKEEELSFMKFILKNAMVLEQMQLIRPKNRSIPIPSPDIRGHLLSFPKGSNVASIVFSWKCPSLERKESLHASRPPSSSAPPALPNFLMPLLFISGNLYICFVTFKDRWCCCLDLFYVLIGMTNFNLCI